MTLKLYFASGASSLAPHILLEEMGLDYQAIKVNLDQKTYKNNQNYNLINPKSYVPTLELNDGSKISECAVILEYLASKNKQYALLADYQTSSYWQQRMWLNYLATELHKNFISPFRKGNWLPNTEKSRQLVWERVYPRLKFIDEQMHGSWLVDNKYSLVDPYLFVMTNWMKRLEFSFEDVPNLKSFDSQMRQRLAVEQVLKDEGKPHLVVETK